MTAGVPSSGNWGIPKSTGARGEGVGVGVFAKRAWSKGQIAVSIVLVVLIAVPVAIALLHQGFPSAEVEMESRDVWVTNAEEVRAGRLNAQIQELDGSVSLTGERVLVHQDGDTVFLHDQASGLLGRVDPSYTDLRESVLTPAGSRSSYGDGTLAIVDDATGKLWLIDTRTALNFDPTAQEPVVELGAGAQVVVTSRGTVIASSPAESAIYRVTGIGAEPVRTSIGQLDDYELTAVGERAAVLDRTNNLVLFEGGTSVPLPEVGVRIQQPGPEHTGVLVAGPTGLLLVPFGGEALRMAPEIVGGGRDVAGVAQPVYLGGCAFGAWKGPKTLTRACDGAEGELHDIAQAITGDIQFRVNRNIIVLNDLQSGNVWLPQENMRLVENWQDTVPPEEQEGDDGENEATEQSFEDTLAERTEENHPPELKEDRFGARPSSVAYLPVLDNDTDPDGDLITITEIKGDVPAAFGELRVIDEGRALQFAAKPDAAGEITLTYVGSDGRDGGVAEANVTIEVVPGTESNRPPESRHVATVTVEAGEQLAYNVLGDWIDPDGDPVYLLSATAPGGMSVATAPDGRISVTSIGAELGRRTVPYVVSDGISQSFGELTVEVAAPQSLSPVGTPDYARGTANTTITVDPLVNDLSPSGAPLSIVEISELEGGAGGATFNPDLGTVSYRASTPGTYYVQYTVSAGSQDSIGLIRFDVLDPAKVTTEITAVRDIGYLRPAQPTTIDVLTNDMSMGDAVLSVQSVTVTDEARIAGVAIELIDNTIVRVTSQVPLLQPIEVPYTITDGAQLAEGVIVLVPVESVVTRQPPMAVDDTRKVRVGDFTSVDVLANDVHPDDAPMNVSPELTDLNIGGGVAFVTGNQVRFQAPKEPGTYSVSYVVTDDYGEQGGARVVFQVMADDEASNRPPAPTTETARVFEGATILVQVPLTGVDPDGDSVTFNGMIGTPTLGSIRDQNQTSFVYEAFPGAAGTDTIRYEVVDTYGQRAEGSIRIGVVPRGEEIHPPVAVDDAVYAKPGSTIAVPVLANDSDPNGYTISIVPDFPEVDPAVAPEVDGDAILITVPTEGQFLSVPYTVTNGQGGLDNAWINVTITDAAPALPPVATDQVVPQAAFDGAATYDVDPRHGAHNPSGRLADLEVDVVGTNAGDAEVLADGRIRVSPTDRRQVIAYTLTSPDTDLHATAFIMVPGVVTEQSKRQSPYLRPDLPEQVTPVDKPLSWDVNDLVVAPSGNRVSVIDAANAWAEQGDGSPVAVSDTRVQYVPKPGFRGPASITFQVSDAETPGDENAGVATIRVKITVGDPNMHDVPPTFVTPQITVEVGTTKTFDLASATGHPNPDVIPQVRYSGLSGSTSQVAGSLSGSTLSLTADLKTPPGTVVPMQVTYTFGEFTQQGSINVTVVSSSKPSPRAVNDSHLAVRGEIVLVDVTANDFNPYPEESLRLLEAVEESSASTGAKISIVGNQVRIETTTSFIGEITVRYKIGDGTHDPLRETSGYATVRVRDKPNPPTTVTLAVTGPSRVTGSWEGAQSNGEPITAYELVLTPDSAGNAPISKLVGVSSTFTFTAADGIVAGVNYRLQVRAQNAIDWGELSSSSDSAMPLDKPTAPQNVTVQHGITKAGETTGSLTVTWSPPAQTGGQITGYRIDIVSPGDQRLNKPIEVGANVNSYTIDGLRTTRGTTGTEFLITVEAVNSEGSTVSEPAAGTLKYQPKPSANILAGPERTTDGNGVKWYVMRLEGIDFLAGEEYEVQCFHGNGNALTSDLQGSAFVKGDAINVGVDLPEPCSAPSKGRFFALIWLNGQLVVTTDTATA